MLRHASGTECAAGGGWGKAGGGIEVRMAPARASELAATKAESPANRAGLRGAGSSQDSHVHGALPLLRCRLSAKADFVWSLQRIHSPLPGGGENLAVDAAAADSEPGGFYPGRVNPRLGKRKAPQTARGSVGPAPHKTATCTEPCRYSGAACPRRRTSCGRCSEFIRPCRLAAKSLADAAAADSEPGGFSPERVNLRLETRKAPQTARGCTC
jgi:hypothetical protein